MTIQEQFVHTLYPIIRREAEARGYQFPVAILAQAAKESGWGKSELSSRYFNYFGMKAGSSWGGVKVDMKTREEYTPGTLTTITDAFRVYGSVEQGVIGYFDFISTKRYANLKTATSEINFFELLRQDGYFTSTTYVQSMPAFLKQCHEIIGDEMETVTSVILYSGIIGVLDDLIGYIADEVIAGRYGNGEARREALGEYYEIIQGRVNARVKNGA